MLINMNHVYKDIISIRNLCEAWREFVRGKKSKKDVIEFSLYLSENILKLHEELKNKTYKHGEYKAFAISDPKPRDIHKASVRDRLLHHAIYRVLYPYFDKKFIYDSYSCRNFKGTHRPLNRFKQFFRQVSKSNKVTCWVLKCDIKKFFANIDHDILIQILKKHISDPDTIWLLERIITSFCSPMSRLNLDIGLPLGNLVSQLLVNIYMNEFDQYIKHKLKIKCYIRYADDFVIFASDRKYFTLLLPVIHEFLAEKLKLALHPDKVFIKPLSSGVDFLGWVHFPNQRILRTTTKRRMLKNLSAGSSKETIASYHGLLKHGNTHKLKEIALKQV